MLPLHSLATGKITTVGERARVILPKSQSAHCNKTIGRKMEATGPSRRAGHFNALLDFAELLLVQNNNGDYLIRARYSQKCGGPGLADSWRDTFYAATAGAFSAS
jgi:hypothetical protein